MADDEVANPIEEPEGGVAPALIAIDRLERLVAVAVGSELRVFDLKLDHAASLLDDSKGSCHSDAIRAITFSANGAVFVSAGDDKLVKIWKTDTWNCFQTVCSEKRVSAVAVSNDGSFVCFADKFGVVWLYTLCKGQDEHVPTDKAVPIFGHYCSIITSMKFSPDGRFIVTADRDYKIRVTTFPKKPQKGAHEIQSFCLGHADFVSCITFLRGYLLSGGGDSTVRLWDYVDGSLLDTYLIGEEAGLVKTGDDGGDVCPSVTDVVAISYNSLVAVAIQSLSGVLLLKSDFSLQKLSFVKVITMETSYIPTSLSMSLSVARLWTVMGASSSGSPAVVYLKVIAELDSVFPEQAAARHGPIVLEDFEVPGGEKLLSVLQGSLDSATEGGLAAMAGVLRACKNNQLTKKQYSEEKRELRKRSRNDKKIKA